MNENGRNVACLRSKPPPASVFFFLLLQNSTFCFSSLPFFLLLGFCYSNGCVQQRVFVLITTCTKTDSPSKYGRWRSFLCDERKKNPCPKIKYTLFSMETPPRRSLLSSESHRGKKTFCRFDSRANGFFLLTQKK